jgi:hypothetical protein
VGSRSVLNWIPGLGLLSVIVDTGAQINIQDTVDSAVILTRAAQQSGQGLLCASNTSSATTYGCALAPTLTAYQTGMVVRWTPDIDGAGGSMSLNIDLLGSRPIKSADGTSNLLVKDAIAGRMYTLWFDGVNFRLIAAPGVIVASSLPPTCDPASRGRMWHFFAAGGAKDQVSVCAKDASDSYAWRGIY